MDELPPNARSDTVETCVNTFKREFAREQAEASARGDGAGRVDLIRVVRRIFCCNLIFTGWAECMFYTFNFFVPTLIGFLFAFLDDYAKGYDVDVGMGVLYAIGIGACAFLASVHISLKFYTIMRAASRARTMMMTAIYEKSLRLAPAAQQKATTGETINLMSADATRIVEAMLFINTVWISPTVIVIALVLLVLEIGVAATAAVGMMLLLLPLQICIGRRIGRQRRNIMRQSDRRIRQMNELLTGKERGDGDGGRGCGGGVDRRVRVLLFSAHLLGFLCTVTSRTVVSLVAALALALALASLTRRLRLRLRLRVRGS